jgi:tripartite ATP-independent transporter DctP family solute receptor
MHQRTILRSVAVGAIALVALTGCRPSDGAPAASEGGDGASAAPVTLVLGHAGSDTDARQVASERFAELVEEASDGSITVEVHPASTLGTWEEMIEGLQLGSIDIVIESLLSVESYTDLASVETAPFLYEDYDQFEGVWSGELGDEILGAVTEASGYEMLGNMYRGPRVLTTSAPVDSIDDVQGLTIRTPSAPTMLATWEAIGARAEALPFNEVYSALESGVIDGQENPLDAILFNSIHEVNPYIAETNHMYANYHFIMWQEALAGLPESQQEIIREAAEQVGEEYTENTLEQMEEYRAQLEEGGVTFSEVSDREAWIEATQPVVEGLPDQVQTWVSQIREQ